MATTISPTAEKAHSSKPKRRVRVWLERGLAGFVTTIVVFGGIGAVYQAIAASSDLRKFPPPGQFVDLDGRRIHLLVKGNETGGPR
jgi:hypothetical protein